jgi:catechol 2,3-dioxygenase-like lactoylglutathione lyase family enzyme
MGATPTFAHVVFQTGQLERMRQWYMDLLDGHVVYEGHNLCFLTHDEEHHRVALVQPSEPLERKAPNAAWMHHVAYTFASLEGLFQRYADLKEKGIEPVMPIQHGVTTSLYYEDPDGNFVEMQVDNFPAPDQATAYMYGPEFDADPIGPRFSPDALLAALRAGVPATELTTRAWALAHPCEVERDWPQAVQENP